MDFICGRRQFVTYGALGFAAMAAGTAPPRTEHIWRVIGDDTYYGGTFGSFNSKIAVAGTRWFVPYRVGHEESGTFKLMCSEDEGRNWKAVPLEPMPCYQVPSMIADGHGRLHLTFHHAGVARCARVSPDEKGTYQLDFVKEIGSSGPKFALAYDAGRQRLYFSHRFGGRLAIATLDLDGKLLSKKVLIQRVGTFPPKGAAMYEDAQYQSITVDPAGTVHLIYTRTVCRNEVVKRATTVTHRYAGVFYLRSRDGGVTWEDGGGKALTLPAEMTAGTQIHQAQQDHDGLAIWGQSLAADRNFVHILYWAEDAESKKLRSHYVRLDAEGRETARSLPPLAALHSALAVDVESNSVFAFGTDVQRRPTVVRAEEDGKAWSVLAAFQDLPLRTHTPSARN